MPKIDIWMPWYIADYQADTAHLTPPQDSAYRKLLEHQWRTRKPLPNDVLALIQITKMTPFFVDASSIPQVHREHASSIGRASALEPERDLYAWILDLLFQFFHQNKDGTWSQLRLERELKIWGDRSDVYHERAKKAAAERWAAKHALDAANAGLGGDATSIKQGKSAHKTGDATSIKQGKSAHKTGDATSIKQGKSAHKTGGATSIAPAMLEQCPSPSPVVQVLKGNYPRDFVPGSRSATGARSSRSGSASSTTSNQSSSTSGSPFPAPKSGKRQNASRHSPGLASRAEGVLDIMDVRKVGKKLIAADVTTPDDRPNSGRGVDPRFEPFREEIFRAFESMYSVGMVKTKRPSWGPLERKQMNIFLSSNPDVTFPIFKEALVNWSRSDNVVLSTPPYRWIAHLMAFSVEIQDRFGMAKRGPRRF